MTHRRGHAWGPACMRGVNLHSTCKLRTFTTGGRISSCSSCAYLTRDATRSSHTLSSGVLPWWAVCWCPNLILLHQAEGHDAPAYTHPLLRMSVKVGESESLCLKACQGHFWMGGLSSSFVSASTSAVSLSSLKSSR